MGTAFIAFHIESWEPHAISEKDIIVEIERVIFRSIIEAMELDKESDPGWKSQLDAAYGIKWLYVGVNTQDDNYDFGPAFINALIYIKTNGPPEYYPKGDLNLLYEQLDLLERVYLEQRR